MILTPKQEAIRDVALRFSREVLRPGYQAREREGVIDRKLLRQLGSLGLIGPDLPDRFGGIEAGSVVAGLVCEAIAYGDFNFGCVQMMGSLLGALVARHAIAEVGVAWTRRLAAGEVIFCIAMTKPKGGADAANIQMKARRAGDAYILSGEKTSISFCDQCDAMIVLARTGMPAEGAHGVTAFFVPTDLPGLSWTRYDDLGSKIVGRGSVFFDNVSMPVTRRLGGEGKGFTQVMQGFDYSRILLSLMCIAAAQASIDETWAYTRDRQSMGVAISQHQGVSFPLVEFETMLAGLRQLGYYGLSLAEAGRPYRVESVDGSENRVRCDSPVHPDRWALCRLHGSATPAALARCDGIRVRRRSRADHEIACCTRTRGTRQPHFFTHQPRS